MALPKAAIAGWLSSIPLAVCLFAANTHDSMLLEAVVDAVAVECSGRLGRYRYVVERSLAWLVGDRRQPVRYERRADVLLGFVQMACALSASTT